MKLQMKNIARNNVNAIKALVNTTFGATPEVEQDYAKDCYETSAAEGYAVIFNKYYDLPYNSRDDHMQELLDAVNPYCSSAYPAQHRGFELAKLHLKEDRLVWSNSKPTYRYKLEYTVDVTDVPLVLRFVHNLARMYRNVEVSLT